jgi:hypothetical protein
MTHELPQPLRQDKAALIARDIEIVAMLRESGLVIARRRSERAALDGIIPVAALLTLELEQDLLKRRDEAHIRGHVSLSTGAIRTRSS